MLKLIANVPEVPIIEEWLWAGEVIVATDGTEQRISLSDMPKRSVNLLYGLDTEEEVVQVTNGMFMAGPGVDVPFYQAATRLTALAEAGDTALAFIAGRTDLRAGSDALIFDASGRRERVTIVAVSAIGATLAGPLVGSWGARANVAPIWPCYSSGQISISRTNPDYSAELKAGFTELGFMSPFANEFAPFVFTIFGDYPVLQVNSIGNTFEQSYDTGAQIIDYGSTVEIRNPWSHAQIVMPRQFLCQRVLQRESWDMWRAFADYARGSTNPFYLPTFRQDFPISIPPVAGGDTFSWKGVEYVEDYAPFEPFKQLAIFFEDGGVHYAAVSNSEVVGGNSVVTFEPALPVGIAVNKVSILLKVRIADDKISCEHDALQTILTINLRTAD